MEKMCRLCLTVPLQNMNELTDGCDVLTKLTSCMNIQVPINLSNTLPSHVCNSCIKQIDDVYMFHKVICDNQKRLQDLTTNSQALDFFNGCVTTEVLIKEEKDATKNSAINQDNYDNYLSEDEVNLFTLKQEKEQTKPKTKSKKHKKNNKEKKPVRIKQKYESYTFKCLMCLQNCDSQIDLKNHYYKHSYVGNDKGQENEFDINRGSNKKTEKCIAKLHNESKCKCENIDNCKCLRKDVDKMKGLDNKPFICKLCGRTYKTVYEIMCHARAHDGPKLHCSLKCGFSTAYKGALKEHERRHGNPDYKYTCESCGKGFHVKTWYYQHLNVHNGLKPFVCDICGVGFHMDRYLSAHRSKVHKKSTSTKRHICVKCLLPCDSRDSLKRHMEEHGIKTSYLCDLCGKVFANAQHLKCHKNIHLGVKPYSCSICKKSFAKKFNLGIHERTHTGERSHACHICGKYFVQRSTLSRHNRRHHPELNKGASLPEAVATT
ncbi:hypothetical protein O3G_MSEX004541 [Manduca sexta]|uniref:Uncharacterized protein n=1 Tax=Manduca sexta TaxID=7130 RepID=A0A921YX40_MANSE|nr:hypothetical protein O3G_MSEX004541 [Manduca sexta]